MGGGLLNSSLRKNTIREIKNTKARFFSILAIIALGVGFFVGINSASPSMQRTLSDFYADKSVMDVKLMSTFGFDDDDISAIKNIDGVECVMPSYSSDVIVDVNGQNKVVKFMALPSAYKGNKPLNGIILSEGRLPKKSNEILIEEKALGYGFGIGDKISVDNMAGDTETSDILNNNEFEIVGVAQSSLYISFQRGNTLIGNGSVSFYAMVNEDAFAYKRYTDIYVTMNSDSAGNDIFSDEYQKMTDNLAEKLSELGMERVEIFKSDTVDTTKEQLESSKKQYNEKITEGTKSLKDGYTKLADAKIELDKGKAEYEKKIADSEKELADAEIQLEKGKTELEKSKLEAQQQLETAKYELETAQKEYDDAKSTFNNVTKPQAELAIRLYEQIIDENQKMLDDIVDVVVSLPGSDVANIEEKVYQYSQKIEESGKQIEKLKKELENGEKQLNDAKDKINDANLQYLDKKHTAEKELLEAEIKLKDGEKELENGKKQLEAAKTEGLNKLTEGQKEYADGVRKYDTSAAGFIVQKKTAERKLNVAEKTLKSLTTLKWYTFTRSDLLGYSDYLLDAQRMESVAKIFPVFFLIVAALVCLTTMTRMVDERRTEIGTLKALGYSSKAIASKYLVYATAAAVLGCVFGILIGINTLPVIIFTAYGIMYDVPNFHLVVPGSYAFVGICAAILCTTTVVLIVSMGNLRICPATLMRPKAPKPGKRILLERVKSLWQHMSFSAKVTARNLFRYKIRFAMTVVGVVGCTALIVAAFGLKDSIGVIVEKQFNEISRYNVLFMPSESGTQSELQPMLDELCEDYRTTDVLAINETAVEIPNKKTENLYICVPQSIDGFKKMFTMRERESGKNIDFADCNVILTEKAALLFDVSVGDKLTYIDGNAKHTVKIDAICENYIYNYIYLSPEYYKEVYGNGAEFNTVIAGIKDGIGESERDGLAEEWIRRDDITAVTFVDNIVTNFLNMIKSLDTVILVMILCAAALAFVVLYNLTNINISERVRELATLKVLGFNDTETSSYVYRESMIMTLVGTLLGLLVGKYLCSFIITTVEVDMVMFGREIFVPTYIYAILLTFLFAMLVNSVMYFKMKKIDMIESLKSVE